MPHGLFVDLRGTVLDLRAAGVRPILAHPERSPELLQDGGRIEELIRAGCLVQVSSKSVTAPASGRDERALKGWFRRGMVHVLGSDGHSPSRRPPRLADAYRRLVRWAGCGVADRWPAPTGRPSRLGLPFARQPAAGETLAVDSEVMVKAGAQEAGSKPAGRRAGTGLLQSTPDPPSHRLQKLAGPDSCAGLSSFGCGGHE